MKEEISKEDLLLMVKQLDLSLDARMNRIMGKKDLSGSQAAVLCYLLRHHPEGSCIRELCGELYRLQKKLLRSIREERET